jgi:hypothetical protein
MLISVDIPGRAGIGVMHMWTHLHRSKRPKRLSAQSPRLWMFGRVAKTTKAGDQQHDP